MPYKALLCAAAVLLALPALAEAGIVYLQGASIIHGEVQALADGKLTVTTDFAGEIKLAMDQVVGLTTDRPLVVVMENGEEIRARLVYDPQTGQRLSAGAAGATPLAIERLVAIRTLDAPSPAEVELAARRAAQENIWSGQLQLGLSGNSGNSDSRTINLGGKAQRETENERLFLSLLINKAKQEEEETSDETIASARLEHDISERFFLFAQTEAEHDEFENIDFRSTTSVGPGYFFIQEPGQELKGRLGLGYEYIDPVTGDATSEAVMTLGYDYLVDVRDWFRFTHVLTLIPQITDSPAENYRIDSTLGLEAPLGGATSNWSLLAQYRHEYNHSPEPGTEDLDTSYLLSLIRDFE